MSFGGGSVPQSVQFVLGGLAGMTASAVTHPLDTLKVQLQLQGQQTSNAGSSAVQKRGVMDISKTLLAEKGLVKGFYPGLSASLARQGTYTTTRMGLYMQLRGEPKDGQKIPVWRTAGASMIAGAVGAFVGNPNDVVLVRMQGDLRLPAEQQRNYRHVFDGWFRIAREEGFAKLYTGAVPNMQRAALITLGQLACYDNIKGMLLTAGMGEGLTLQFVASTLAGGITAAITNPVDVLKTRIMQSGEKTSAPALAKKILANEGAMAFYKGFLPYFSRMGPQTVVTLMAYEQYAKVYQMLRTDK